MHLDNLGNTYLNGSSILIMHDNQPFTSFHLISPPLKEKYLKNNYTYCHLHKEDKNL